MDKFTNKNLARCLALNVYHWGYIFLVSSVIDDMAYSWLGVVIFDVCVFGLTLWKVSKMRAIHGGIGTIVMRDGK
ncbi:hypothetical protein HHX47_DHR1001271 [Lentinula edodes]|nr:hypothetical protein HHX47_DHR1001271 [Lentinula edodes]